MREWALLARLGADSMGFVRRNPPRLSTQRDPSDRGNEHVPLVTNPQSPVHPFGMTSMTAKTQDRTAKRRNRRLLGAAGGQRKAADKTASAFVPIVLRLSQSIGQIGVRY